MFKRLVYVPLILCLLACVASAAELTMSGEGALLNGAAVSETPVVLAPGDRVQGPATVTTAAGDSISPARNSVLEVKEPEGETELFFLIQGSARGELGNKASVALPAGWLTGPAEGKAKFYVETIDPSRGFYQINEGKGLVSYGIYHVFLGTRQAVELAKKERPTTLEYYTHQSNPGTVQIIANTRAMAGKPGALELTLSVPKSTRGVLEQVDGGEWTRVASDASSLQGAKIKITTLVDGSLGQSGSLGPGTFAKINNATGEIEFGFVEIDFAILDRAISLTSEFTTLAVSNFFGLE
jgi:hypothetical protein